MKWENVTSQVDNWIWLLLAVAVYVVGKYLTIPEMYALAGACIVKIKDSNGSSPERSEIEHPEEPEKVVDSPVI